MTSRNHPESNPLSGDGHLGHCIDPGILGFRSLRLRCETWSQLQSACKTVGYGSKYLKISQNYSVYIYMLYYIYIKYYILYIIYYMLYIIYYILYIIYSILYIILYIYYIIYIILFYIYIILLYIIY